MLLETKKRKFHQRALATLGFVAECVCILGSVLVQDDCEAIVDAFVNSHHCPIRRKGIITVLISSLLVGGYKICGWQKRIKLDSCTNSSSSPADRWGFECALHMHTLRSQLDFTIAIFYLKKRREKIGSDVSHPLHRTFVQPQQTCPKQSFTQTSTPETASHHAPRPHDFPKPPSPHLPP